MIRWSTHLKVPFYILLTKADKAKSNERKKSLTKVASTLEMEGINFGIQLFSATKLIGVSLAQERISSWLTQAILYDK